jgi:hypothetical protein
VGVVQEQTITGVAGQRDYSLNADFISALTVEFPESNDPRDYLTRLSERHSHFTTGQYYDIRRTTDLATTLVLGDTPASGEDIQLTYLARASTLSDDTTAIEIPDEHLHVLRLRVIEKARWAWYEKHVAAPAQALPQSPGVVPQLLSHLLAAATRAHEAYKTAIGLIERGPWDDTVSWQLWNEYTEERWA